MEEIDATHIQPLNGTTRTCVGHVKELAFIVNPASEIKDSPESNHSGGEELDQIAILSKCRKCDLK